MENHINAETCGHRQGDPRRGRRLRRHRRRPRHHRIADSDASVADIRVGCDASVTGCAREHELADLRRRRVHVRAVRRATRPASWLDRRRPDAEWMQQVAAEMKHSETAFVDAARRRRRSTCAGSRPRSRSTCAATRRSRARTCSSRPGASRRRGQPCSTRAAASSAPRREADGAITLDFPAAPPEPCDRPCPASSTRSASTPAEFLRTDGEFFMLRRRPTPRPCATLAPDFASIARARRRARRLRDRARRRRRVRHRVALLRARGRHRRGPGDRLDALRARRVLVRPRLGKDELRAYQASARGGELRVRTHGDRALLTGHAIDRATRRAARATRVTRCQASCAATPSRSETCGSQPSSSRARSIAPPLRNASPGCAGCGSTATGAPATSPTSAIRSLSVISPPPARFTYVPGRDVGARPPARLPRTMSST